MRLAWFVEVVRSSYMLLTGSALLKVIFYLALQMLICFVLVFWWCDRERGVAGMMASQILPFGGKYSPLSQSVKRFRSPPC